MKYKGKYEKLLGELPDPNMDLEISTICPFHEDKKKSASINVKTGLFHCFACNQDHNFITFQKAYQEEHGLAAPPDDDDVIVRAIPDQVVRDLHFALITNQQILDRLLAKRGIGIETIKKWQIGFHERTARIAIPIRDEKGVCVNIRLYSFSEKGSQKMLSWKAGYGKARLWPLDAFLDPKYVILCEGEMDRLILDGRGLNAVTSTGGAKTWKSEWSKHFSQLKVYIIYDNDQTGEEGARKAAASISEFALEVRIVRLDLAKSGEDITDYFVNYGYDIGDLKKAIKAAPIYRRMVRDKDTEQGKSEWVNLGNSLLPQNHERDLMIPVIVSARRDERMYYPKETVFSCNPGDAGKVCERCAMNSTGTTTVTIKRTDKNLIDFVGVSQKEQISMVKARAGIPKSCVTHEAQTTESGTLEELLITPEIETSASEDSVHLIQRAFYIGVGLDYNSSYILKTRTVPFHKTSKLVHHVMDAMPAHDSIDSFEMTPEIHERLKIFQAEPGRAKHKLAEVMANIQDHVTRIWDRLDLHVGMDLVWHSILEFEFDNEIIRRGWVEAIVVGDTRTGKSKIASELQRHYGYGEIVSGENTSYAGLVGGAVKHDDSWFVKWGRIPLNDRRMIVIDEVTGMTIDDIALMSGLRETGVADITKIESQRANARTRALWIGNVRHPKRELSDYDFGCESLEDIIGQPEDIARFDYAMAAARNEVSPHTVNSDHPKAGELLYSSQDCGSLVLWAWSRGRDTVQFQREAVEACWRHAIEMGEIYTPTMPLVMSENQRIKLARVGAAIAARLFSTDDGENLIVTEEHIDTARWFIDKMYKKQSFGYFDLSEQKRESEKVRLSGDDELEMFLSSRPVLCDYLVRTKYISTKKINENANSDNNEAISIIQTFNRYHMLEDRGNAGYLVSPILKKLAKKYVRQPGTYDYHGG